MVINHYTKIMAIERTTPFGGINISSEAVAQVAGEAASRCYGVVGLVSRSSLEDAVSEILKIEEYLKGVYTRKRKDTYEIDLYIVVAFGVKVTEVMSEVQKNVSYTLEKTFGIPFRKVNVYVQGIKELN